MNRSCAFAGSLEDRLVKHLARPDLQEDLCFAIWRPSRGKVRTSALLHQIILPTTGDRDVHGNAAFRSGYFQRTLDTALQVGGGIAFLHSHPLGAGWQGLSPDDYRAEEGMAGAVHSATGLPLVGLTLAVRDGTWSARFWERSGKWRRYKPQFCESVRVVGDRLAISFNPRLLPIPKFGEEVVRTISAWGERIQGDLSRIKVGIVGLGSVGSIIAEALARTGFREVLLLDFDFLTEINLDRTLNAAPADARHKRSKVRIAARAYRKSACVRPVSVDVCEFSVCEDEGYRRALDCDVLFSCVDRPWPRSVLNFVAYAHDIPVVDGGIHVSRKPNGTMRGADWKAHIAAPGRRCLECLGQYDPGLVAAERDGFVDDPSYMEKLPGDHPLKAKENVFAFSLGTASLEVLQLLMMVVAPSGVGAYGAQNYHFVTGAADIDVKGCESNCLYPPLISLGDEAGHPGTVPEHAIATLARERSLAE